MEILPVTGEFSINDHQEFWQTLVKGSAPVVMVKNSMPTGVWEEKELVALEYLQDKLPSLPVTLHADAWLGCGVK